MPSLRSKKETQIKADQGIYETKRFHSSVAIIEKLTQ